VLQLIMQKYRLRDERGFLMTKNKLTGILLASSLLAGCSVHTDMGSKYISKVTEERLQNGTLTKVGFITPEASWQCKRLDRKTYNWASNEVKGMIKIGGGYEVLHEQAIAYANSQNLKPNYILLEVPQQTSINGFNLDYNADSAASYFKCKTTPPLKTSLF